MRRRPLPPVREENSNVKSWRSACESDFALYTLVASVGALTYANCLNGEFVHDDIPAIVTNGDVNGGRAVLSVFRNDFWGTPMSDPNSHKSYRPLTTLSFRLNYVLFGLSAWWWHAVNVLLHALCCALVLRAGAVLARLERPFAALAALLFAVHPVHTEAEIFPIFKESNPNPLEVLTDYVQASSLTVTPELKFKTLLFISALQTVTYGMKSSSYLATRCLKELAELFGNEYPRAAEVLTNNTYVDDILAGAMTVSDAIQVAGVVGRADVLACVFYLSSILLYHGCVGRHRVWASVLLAALSMLAKETGLTALLFSVGFDLYRSWTSITRSSVRWRWRSEGVWSRVACGLFSLGLLVGARLALLQGSLPAFSPQDNPPAFHPSFAVRLMTFCYLAAFNWWLLLCPWTLSHDWQMGSIPLVTSPWDPRNILTGAAVIALLALAYRCFMDLDVQRHTPAVAGLMLLVIPYLPASNLLVTVGFVVAERVLYIPSIGSIFLTVYGMQLVWRRQPSWRRALVFGVAILVLGGVVRTHIRNRDWRTRETLLRADLAVLPHNAKLHYNFANFLKDSEQQESAIKHYHEALKLWPSYASAHNNLGTLVVATGRAEHHFLQALKYNRDHVNAHYNLAKLYRKKNRISDSLKMLERCISLEPRFVQAHLELLQLTPEGERRHVLDTLVLLEPHHWEHRLLYGHWLKGRGLYPLSLEYYTQAMRLSFRSEPRGRGPSVRAASLLLRSRGQWARILQLLTRWHTSVGWGPTLARRLQAQRAWRLRTELAGRAALYARPLAPHTTTSTCLHHSQLEVTSSSYKLKRSDTADSKLLFKSGSTSPTSQEPAASKVSCTKRGGYKKGVSISAQYKPTHNKSETGHKQKSCPLHKKKTIKNPETYQSFMPDHLIKTY